MVIKRVGALSLAKVAAVLYAGMGLLFGGLVSLFSLLGAAAWMTRPGAQPDGPGGPMFGALFGVGAIILLPIFYGILGFIGTLIAATLFNVAARMTGGVEIEVQ
jgi:hypothetical protein